MSNVNLPRINKVHINTAPSIVRQFLNKTQYKPPVGNLSAYARGAPPRLAARPPPTLLPLGTRQRPQFAVGERMLFRDARTGQECSVIGEASIPSHFKYLFRCLRNSDKPLLCLDMDQTLIYSQMGTTEPADVHFTVRQGNARVTYSTIYRPGLHHFLRTVQPHYDIMVFTSAG